MPKTDKMLTAAQVAERLGVSDRTVRLWLKKGSVKGAVLVETLVGTHWEIPERSIAGLVVRGRGRPAKTKRPDDGSGPNASKD